MRIAFIGCVEFSRSALEVVLSIDEATVCGVMTREKSDFNADFCNLGLIAEQKGIKTFYADGKSKEEQCDFLKEVGPDVIYCFGWSYLLSQEMLDVAKLGVVGYHPASLPANRGRHPIIWTLVLGLKKTSSTFFLMDVGTDSGPIVSQIEVDVCDDDDANSLYEALTDVAMEQIKDFTLGFAKNSQTLKHQDDTKANYWRKRNAKDGLIDWRMSARSVYNLVRALRAPYPGADVIIDEGIEKIWSVKINNSVPDNIEPGKVVKNADGVIIVKCGEDALEILEHTCPQFPKEGEYL